MSKSPSSTVKVPPSAANYTAATLDPELRTSINSLLIKEGHVTKIQDLLLHKLNSHTTNWPTAIQDHALALLRSGEVTTFPALLKRVLDDVRADTLLARAANGDPSGKKGVNGASAPSSSSASASAGSAPHNLAVPKPVLEEALKITRDHLETVCEIEDPGAS